MARFNAKEIDNYGTSSGSSFFSLKNDKDTAIVRFMYNDINDIEAFAVHEVMINGTRRYANCLRSYDEPVDDCPLCAAGMRVIAKMYIPLYDEEEKTVKVWERGRTFYSKISSLASRYKPLVSTIFEVERNGKKGDMKTTYETYVVETDDTVLEDLPEVDDPLGTIILDKDFDELTYYLDYGDFPEDRVGLNSENESNGTVRRSGRRERAVEAEPRQRTSDPTERRRRRTRQEVDDTF